MPTTIGRNGLRRNRGYRGFVGDSRGVLSECPYGFFLSDHSLGGTRYYVKNGDHIRIMTASGLYTFYVRI